VENQVSTKPETIFAADQIPATPLQSADRQMPGSSSEKPPWGIPAAVLTWLVSIAMLAIVPNICVLPYMYSRYRGVAVTQEMLFADKTFIFLFVLGWLPAHLLTLALVWAVATRLGKRSIKEVFRWSWSPSFGFWMSAALAVLMFIATVVLTVFLGGKETELDRIVQSSRAAAVALATIAVLTAPLVEEMIYRGLLYSAFEKAIGPWGAVIVVASMFAGLHVVQYWPNAGAISSITLLSVILTSLRAQTGRLLPCYVVHLVFNGIQSVLIILEPYIRAGVDLYRHQPVKGAFNLLRFFN
jgi:membrane protease YdiL (CAAX protease family)